MSEQVNPSVPHEYETVSDDTEVVATIEAVLNTVKSMGREIAQVSYATAAEARAVCMSAEAVIEQKLNQCPDMTTIPLRISGEGVDEVVVPQDVSSLEEALESIDSENPFTPLDPNDSCDFSYDYWQLNLQEVEPDDWRIMTYLYGQKPVIPTERRTPEGVPFLKIPVVAIMRINCGINNSPIESVGLAERRERKQILADLTKLTSEDEHTVLSGLFQSLTNSIDAAEPDYLVTVDDIQMLHTFGEIGAQYADENIKKADTLANAIIAHLGKNRRLKLDGSGYVIGQGEPTGKKAIEVYGKVETIVTDMTTPDTSDGRSTGLTFIISDAGQMYALPFVDIAKMSL